MQVSERIAVCSGSFDPVTIGHVDIFERASRMFDELVVCVFHNIRKQSYFTIDERRAFLEQATAHLPNVRVDAFSGLLTDYMRSIGAHIIVRGVRSVKDLEYEENEAHMLHHLDASVETVFLLTNPAYSFVSSSGIRELAAFRGDVHGLVPACVERAVRARWSAESREGSADAKAACRMNPWFRKYKRGRKDVIQKTSQEECRSARESLGARRDLSRGGDAQQGGGSRGQFLASAAHGQEYDR